MANNMPLVAVYQLVPPVIAARGVTCGHMNSLYSWQTFLSLLLAMIPYTSKQPLTNHEFTGKCFKIEAK